MGSFCCFGVNDLSSIREHLSSESACVGILPKKDTDDSQQDEFHVNVEKIVA